MLAAAAMIFKPLRAWRRSLVNTGVFFAACLVGDLLAGCSTACWRHRAALAARDGRVRRRPGGHPLPGLALFDVVLPRCACTSRASSPTSW
jgi:hypothetical protein